VDMSKHKKDTPAQKRERLQWIVDTVRENQELVMDLLQELLFNDEEGNSWAFSTLSKLHKHERDAILLPNGILTNEQIEILSPGRLASNAETDE